VAETAEKIVRVLISGHVQGVGFRAWTVREASRLQLRGWVRNRTSGDVEAVFAGARAEVDAMLTACGRGPRYAGVARVTVAAADDTDLLPSAGFREIGTI
jgi:acylphosphatase